MLVAVVASYFVTGDKLAPLVSSSCTVLDTHLSPGHSQLFQCCMMKLESVLGMRLVLDTINVCLFSLSSLNLAICGSCDADIGIDDGAVCQPHG